MRQPPFYLYSFSSHFFFLPPKLRRLTMESALLQNSPFTISDDQFDPSTVDLLADAIFSNSIQRNNKARRSTGGDDKRKFDQVDGAIRSANPPKTTREFRRLFTFSLLSRYLPILKRRLPFLSVNFPDTNHRDSVHSMSSNDSGISGK